MHKLKRIQMAWKVFRELGIRSTSWYAIYHLGLSTGYYFRALPKAIDYPNKGFEELYYPLPIANQADLKVVLGKNEEILIDKANEIVNGRFHPFAGDLVNLNLITDEPLVHWTEFETRKSRYKTHDIKFVWEAARFQWAFILARAYVLTGHESFSLCFWNNFNLFEEHNPPFLGVNWISSQEVGIRLIGMTFAASSFQNSKHSTLPRQRNLISSMVNHAQRIKLTLPYALAQRNNHLLSEAVGLFTAGVVLPQHPEAASWQKTGWKIFNYAINDQIDKNGVFIQHSMNYHRLMLHDALWFHALARYTHKELPISTKEKLAKSVYWLLSQMDFQSGATPNLGHNDGSNFLKLDCCEYPDYRPIAQAGSIAFLEKRAFSSDFWDEACLWLSLDTKKGLIDLQKGIPSGAVQKLRKGKLTAFFRIAKFYARPAHADQLHLDIWWDSLNIARDAGTYQYNLPPPWTNSLTKTLVHNTITVDEQDQMTWAGRFLWLDWAQAKIVHSSNADLLIASHDGYRNLGITHERQVKLLSGHELEVLDELHVSSRNQSEHAYWLQWLLPDLQWKTDNSTIAFLDQEPYPKFSISIQTRVNGKLTQAGEIQLIREGKNLLGERKVSPILGWYSGLYGKKVPGLSFRVCINSKHSVSFLSLFQFS
jgi:hypothetical protein